MLYSLGPSELDFCARTIALMDDEGEPEHVRASLAWLIRNRLQFAATAANMPPCVEKTCKQIVREAVGRLKANKTMESFWG